MVLSMVISMLSVGYHICNDVNLDGFLISQGAGEGGGGRLYGLNSSLLEKYIILYMKEERQGTKSTYLLCIPVSVNLEIIKCHLVKVRPQIGSIIKHLV